MHFHTDDLAETALFGTHEVRWAEANPDGTDVHLKQAVATRAAAREAYRGVNSAVAEIDANPELTTQGKTAAKAKLVAWRSNLDRERANMNAIESERGQLIGTRKAFDGEHADDAINGSEIRTYLAPLTDTPGGIEQAARVAIADGDTNTFRAIVNASRLWPGALPDAVKAELRDEYFASHHPVDAERIGVLDEIVRTLEGDFSLINEAINLAAGTESETRFSNANGG